MGSKSKFFREYIISSLAVSMLIVLWVFSTDAFSYGLRTTFKVVGSIVIYAFVICLVQIVIRLLLDNRPIISILAEYAVVVLLFSAFGIKFNWYFKGKEWFVFIYTIPVCFFSGRCDYTVNYSMSEAYLKKISAPMKGFYLFKESAHSPIFEEPEKVLQIIQNDVLKGRNDLSETY